MDNIIYSKTSKGFHAITNGTPTLPFIVEQTLSHIDGKANSSDIHSYCPHLTQYDIERALDWLLKYGFIKSLVNEPQAFDTLDAISVAILDQERSVQEWAKAQRMAKSLAHKGYCSTWDIKQTKPKNPVILVVEDDSLLAQLEIAILKTDDYLVNHVTSGEMALERLQKGDLPDVMILDVTLPGIDGFETLRQIRSNEDTSCLPVVMVTSSISDEDVMAGISAGADGYIFKPFSPEKLITYLSEVLGW